jgi:hypothetical protein
MTLKNERGDDDMHYTVRVAHTDPDTGVVTDRLAKPAAHLHTAKARAIDFARRDPNVVSWVEVDQGYESLVEIYYQSSRRSGKDLEVEIVRRAEGKPRLVDGHYFHGAIAGK